MCRIALCEMRGIAVEIVDPRSTVVILIALGHQVEIILDGGLDAQVLRPKRSDVEVHLQDFPLGILLRQADCQRSFWYLATKVILSIARQLFDQLLCECTSSALYGACLGIFDSGTHDTHRVYTGICPECWVFGGGHCILQNLRDVLKGDRRAESTTQAGIIKVIKQKTVAVINMGCLIDLPVCQPL